MAGEAGLATPVTWVVSLRPYAPAFPRLRGGELALVATEYIARLEPPTTLADVIRQLVSRDAAGVAVRGTVDERATALAQEHNLPLLQLQPDAPLPDIEQAIMRVCALYQARREMLPAEEPDAWVDDLLADRIASPGDLQSRTRRGGYRPGSHYTVAYVPAGSDSRLDKLPSLLASEWKNATGGPVTRPWEGGLAVLAPQGTAGRLRALLMQARCPAGLGEELPVLEAPASLAQARLAATASLLLYDHVPVRYADLGADRLLLLLYRDHPEELRLFVDETLGPLLGHDATSPTPLLPTLSAFLAHAGRLRETSEALFVHRNTLAYRLDRAAEVLDVDLRNEQVRLSLELALRALPLVRRE
jgi:hypothetical protein